MSFNKTLTSGTVTQRKTWPKLSRRRSRWKLLRRASKQDCPSSIVLPLLYSAAAAQRTYVRVRVNRASWAHMPFACGVMRRCTHIRRTRDSRCGACVFWKRNRKAGTEEERTANVRRIESRLITAFGHVASCIPLLRSGMNRKVRRTSSFFSFLYEKSRFADVQIDLKRDGKTILRE